MSRDDRVPTQPLAGVVAPGGSAGARPIAYRTLEEREAETAVEQIAGLGLLFQSSGPKAGSSLEIGSVRAG